MESSRPNIAPTIHYTWVGPPNNPGIGVPGHDVAGPISMAKANKHNPIIFWCLFEHLDHYKKKFEKHPNIQVRSIEHHIEKELTNYEEQADQLIDIMQKCLNEKKNRNTIRDRVTVKEAFSLFLLCTQAGYVLDTNIIPIEESIALPAYTNLKAPAFKEQSQDIADFETWMLYSPAPGNEAVITILSNYYLSWRNAEKHYRSHGADRAFYDLIGCALSIAIAAEYYNEKINLWIVPDIENNFVLVKELNLIKIYSNTHKYELRKKFNPTLFAETKDKDITPSEIFISVRSANDIWLKLLIEHGVDVNETIKKPSHYNYRGETPLHEAIKINNVSGAAILLEAGADPDMPALYPDDVELTARDLMVSNERFHDLLAKLPPINPDRISALGKGKRTTRADVIAFRKQLKRNWQNAIELLNQIPKNQLAKFIKLANLRPTHGQALVDYAEKTQDNHLLLALLQANGRFFNTKPPEYVIALYGGLNVLKDHQLDQDPFLSRFLVENLWQFRALIKLLFDLYDAEILPNDKISTALLTHPDEAQRLIEVIVHLYKENLFQDDDILEAVLSHPENAIGIYTAISRWKVAEKETDDVLRKLILTNSSLIKTNFISLRKLETKNLLDRFLDKDTGFIFKNYPEEANNLAKLIIALAAVNKISNLNLFLMEPNTSLRIQVGIMLAHIESLDKIDAIEKLNLFDTGHIFRLFDAVAESTEIANIDIDEAKENFNQFIQSINKEIPFKP